MSSKIGRLFLRILFIPVVGFFVWQLFSVFVKSVNDIVYALTNDTGYHIFLRFDTREIVVLWLSFFWAVSLLLLETAAAFRQNFGFRRLLVNLRYAPFFILLFGSVSIAVFDFGMIEYSKHRIRNYLYQDSPIVEKPALELHNNYRGWCGNGYWAQENYLYFETAAEGFQSADPRVRSRSLLMAAEMQNLLNGGDERFDDFLAQSCRDADRTVRRTAEDHLAADESSCEKYLSSR